MSQRETSSPPPQPSQGLPCSDEHLAALARGGCRASFEELVGRFQVRLLRFLQRRVRATSDAEDLVQETFVRAFQRLHRYDEKRRFGTWLFTIAHRLSISHHRRGLATARASDGFAQRMRDQTVADPGRQIADDEDRRRFWEIAAGVLSAEQMSATWLFYVEQMPAPQIAEILGRSWVSVKTILFRSRRRLMPFLVAEGSPESASLVSELASLDGGAAVAAG